MMLTDGALRVYVSKISMVGNGRRDRDVLEEEAGKEAQKWVGRVEKALHDRVTSVKVKVLM